MKGSELVMASLYFMLMIQSTAVCGLLVYLFYERVALADSIESMIIYGVALFLEALFCVVALIVLYIIIKHVSSK